MDLSNENIVHIKKEGIEYIQFRRLLEFPEIKHAYVIGLDNSFKIYTDDGHKKENEVAKKSYKKICNELDIEYKNLVNTMQNHTDNIKIVKNKVSAPFREIMVDLIYGKGIQKESELVNLAEQAGIIEKAGSWYSYNSERIAQGKENLKNYMHDHPDFAAELEQKIREKAGNLKLENDENSVDAINDDTVNE